MGIHTTLGALVDAEAALQRLLTQSLPVKTAYHVAKLSRLVAAETALFQQQRVAALREFGAERDGTPEEQGQGQTRILEVTHDHRPAFFARMNEIAALEVSLPWDPLPLEALAAISITGTDLLALEPLMTVEAPDPPKGAA